MNIVLIGTLLASTGPANSETAEQTAPAPAPAAKASATDTSTNRLAGAEGKACDVETLCLTRVDLALLFAARALAEEGLHSPARQRYEKLIAEHPSSPLRRVAQNELALLKTGPMHTGPMRLTAKQSPRQSGTFSGILLGAGLSAFTTVGVFVLAEMDAEEILIITTVGVGALGAYVAADKLRKNPQTLGVMETATLGALWMPIVMLVNLDANDVRLGEETPLLAALLGWSGAYAGMQMAQRMNLHAGAATLAWTGAVLGAVETGLVIASVVPEFNSGAGVTALISLGSAAGLVGGALWARDRRFSVGRGRLMNVGAYGGALLASAFLSLMNVQESRVYAATLAAAFPLGAVAAYMFTEEYDKARPQPQASTNNLNWALEQTLAQSQ